MSKVLLTLFLAMGLFMADVEAWQSFHSQGGNPDNVYMEVQLNTAAGRTNKKPTHGDLVEWDVDSDTGETLGYTVHSCDGADSELVAGIVPAWDDYQHNLDTHGSLSDGDVFLIQVRGYHSGAATDGTVTEGQGVESDANGHLTDGDGLGVAFKTDAANDSTNQEAGSAGTFAPIWFDFSNINAN